MIVLDGPVLILDGEDCWRLVHRRGHRHLAATIERLAAAYDLEHAWRRNLEPVAKVAADLGITVDALRKRLRRGTWPGQQVARHWWAVPPGSPGAPPSTT